MANYNFSFKKGSKEFEVMQQFFALTKKFAAADTDEQMRAYHEAGARFAEDDNACFKIYKKQLVAAWGEKLEEDRKVKLQLLKKFYLETQNFTSMTSDEEWEKAVDWVSTLSKESGSLRPLVSSIGNAWLMLVADLQKEL